MSEWRNLTLEQKLVTPPIRKTVPIDDFPGLIRADMEWKTEISEQTELTLIYRDTTGSGRARWSHMVHEEKTKALAKEGEPK